jgi:GH15 family glucan-1,4-alpha-glucosidase
MPRALVLGNGSMLATFDKNLQMRDLYYPFVGSEDHTTYGNVHKVGFLVEGKGFSWLDDGSWTVTPSYTPRALVGASTLRNDKLGIEILSEDFVDPLKTVLVRSFKITTLDRTEHRVQCFFHHDFHIYGDKQKDTAFYEPHTKSVIHYRSKRYFLIGGTTSDPITCIPSEPLDEFHPLYDRTDHIDHCGIVSFSIGKAKYRGLEGTWRDAEDGVLARSPIEQGSVDSTVEIDCFVHADRPTSLYMWLCAGRTLDEVHDLQHMILEETPEQLKFSAVNYWRGWLNAHDHPDAMPAHLTELYTRSLLIIRSQIDNHGGIVAANDSDIQQFNRDTYTYVWPRDGALVSMALTQSGQSEAVQKFLTFCADVVTPEGYLLHKYNPDGSLGSSWHPWYNAGGLQLPIQCDETALPISAAWKHFERYQDFEFLHQIYHAFIKKAADFLLRYSDEKTGLPLPSYDLWEEKRAVGTFTACATIAGLRDASQISLALGHHRHAEKYQEASDRMKQALLLRLYDEKERTFLKKADLFDSEVMNHDLTPDMSIAAVWLFDILPPTDPRVVATMERLARLLIVKTPVGGFARYKNDVYQIPEHPSDDVPGNPWIITTLWYAQWKIATARSKEDLLEPMQWLEWVHAHASPAGILAEQLHPRTGVPLSVAPLTWSHAEYIKTYLMFVQKQKDIATGTKTQIIHQ